MLQAVGMMSGKAPAIILIPLYTRTFNPSEVGTLDIVLVTIDLASPLLFMCLADAVLRFAMEDPCEGLNYLRAAGLWSGLVALVIIISTASATAITGRHLYLAAGLALTLQNAHLLISQFLRARRRFATFAFASILQATTMTLLAAFFLVSLGYGVAGYFYALCVSLVVALLIMLPEVRISHPLPVANESRAGTLLRQMIKYAVPLVPNAATWWLVSSSNRYFLLMWHGAAAVASLGVAMRLTSPILLLGTVMVQTWQLTANDMARHEHRQAVATRFLQKFLAGVLVAVSVTLWLTPLATQHIVGESVRQAWTIIPAALAGVSCSLVGTFIGTLYTASFMTRHIFYSTLAAGCVAVLCNLTLIPSWGSVGAAASTTAAFFTLLIYRVIHSGQFWPVAPKPWPLAILMAITTLQSFVLLIHDGGTRAMVPNAILVILCVATGAYYSKCSTGPNETFQGR